MAYPTEITIGTGSKMSANFQSNEFHVSLTYQLERGDVDLAQLAEEKAAEVENLHGLIRQRVLALRQKPVIEKFGSEKPVAEKSGSNKTASNGAALPDNSQKNEPPETGNPPATDKPRGSSSEKNSHSDPPITTAQQRVIEKLVERCGLPDDELQKLLACRFGHNTVSDLTNRQAGLLIADLQRRIQRLQDEANKEITSKENTSEPAT